MPDILASLREQIANIIANPQPVSAENFFQTRITHTPGVVSDIDPEKSGQYEYGTSPLAALMSSGLPTEIKQKLAEQLKGMNKGLIRVPESKAERSDVLRHESYHALSDKYNLGKYADQIAAMVNLEDPSTVADIKESPLYQREMKYLGVNPTIADEGIAMSQIDRQRQRPQLHDLISRLIGAKEGKQQYEKLTAPR